MKEMTDIYIFYKRKSSDSEDKQILSLDSQDRAIRDVVPNFESLNIIADYEEAKSAKAPGRPKFNSMCDQLESGKANHIICWQLNRLARNSLDGGRVIWLVQHYGVKIVTPTKTYDINDILLMYVEFGMSNQFINDLSKSTMRGIKDKLDAGIAPIRAPIGYYNDVTKKQGLRDILADSERFSLVRKMWDMLLTGNYSPIKILDVATSEWGLRQRNGRPLSRSKIYELFNNIFYTGQFIYDDKLYQGIHKPMVTKDEFERAQKILVTKGKFGLGKHIFAFNDGLIRCICRSAITADEKYRKICPQCHLKYNAQMNEVCPRCKAPAPEKTAYYCYYHCSRKVDTHCRQQGVTLQELEKQVDELLAKLTIPQDFADWALKMLRKVNDEEATNRQSIHLNLQNALNATTRRLDNLQQKYLSDANKSGALITDEEYKQVKEYIQTEKRSLLEQLQGVSSKQDMWMDTAEKAFHFAIHARYWFEHGSKEEKRTILAALGLNLILENKKLRLDLLKPFESIQEAASLLKNELKWLEPSKQTDTVTKSPILHPLNPVWGD